MDSNNTTLTKTVPKLQFCFQGLDFNGHYQTVHLPHSPRPTHTYPNFFPNHPHPHPPKIKYNAPQCQFFKITGQKVQQIFNLFLKEFSEFWIFQLCSIFSSFKNIWAILEKLSRETKNLSFDIWKVLLTKNLVNLKPLTSFEWSTCFS